MADDKLLKFWHIEGTDHRSPQADWDDGMDLEQVSCPRFPEHRRGGKRTTDLKIVLLTTDVEDFIWLGYGGECVIQDHVLQLLRDSQVTGFEVRPVKARFENSAKRAPTLWELVVTGWGGMAKAQSGILLDTAASCLACGYLHYSGLNTPTELIERRSWDGSDFFMVWPMPRYIFVTDRIVMLATEHGFTGIRWKALSELAKTDGFSPGRLHYYMPEPKARQVGEPLGIY